MKILLVAMNYLPERSGTAPYTAAWAQHMAMSNDVTVLAGAPHYPEWQVHDGYDVWRSENVEQGVRVRRMRHVVPSSPSSLTRILHETSFAARVLAQRCDQPDVVLAVSPPLFGAAAARRLARRFGVPFGVVVQDIYSEGVRELSAGGPAVTAAHWAITNVERGVVSAADRILTIHDRFASSLADRLMADPSRIDVVSNWTHVPTPTAARDVVRRQFGWENQIVVLHAGNMGVKQGLETVVDAARLAAARGDTAIRYVLLGDGNQRRQLQLAAEGVANIEFLPPADAATYTDILAAADILLVHERRGVAEMSLPSKLTSYCAVGRPVLAASSDHGATAQVIKASGAGVVVEPGRPEVLHEAAATLAADPDKLARLGANGRSFATANYGADCAMAEYDRWLNALAAAGRRSDPRQSIILRRTSS